MNSNYFKGLFIIISSFGLAILGGWLTKVSYITPLFGEPEKVLADPIGFMSFMLGGGIGLCLICFPNVLSRLIRDKEIPVRAIYIWLASCGILATFANELLYQVVIQPNHMIECPLKLGYKKNLMRDYVLDISQCERF